MSVLSPVDDDDVLREVEKLVIRKPRPASVSCEARTPKGLNVINGESTDQSNGKSSLTSNSSKMSLKKKVTGLTKGKMEIFQIIADPEVAAINETHFNESFSFIMPRNIKGLDKDLLSTPRMDETLNESSNFDKASNKSDTNLEILEKLSALETSLAAMAATKERQVKQEGEMERLLRASNISQSAASRENLQEKNQSEKNEIVTHKTFLQNSAPQQRLPSRQEQYQSSVPNLAQQAPPSFKMARNDFAHLGNDSVLNRSFHRLDGQYSNKYYDFNNQMNYPEQQIMASRQSSQANKPREYPQVQTSNLRQQQFQQNQGQTLTLQSQNLNRTIDSQSETQNLLYKVQQDMITRQREISYSQEHQQNVNHPRNPPNRYLGEVYNTNLSNMDNCANQSYSSDLGNQTINESHHNFANESNVSFVGNELSFCDYGNDPNLYQTGNQPRDSKVHVVNQSNSCNPNNQSFVSNFNQSDVQNIQRQDNHCQNCQPQYAQIRKNDHALNKLDFTKPDPTTNLTLVVKGTRLYIHKEVVSAWSNRWRHLVRVNSSTGDEITLRDTKLPTVQALLEYIYGIHKTITDKNVFMLLELADKFEMPKIKVECERFLVDKTPDMKLLIVAQNFRLQQLYKKNLDFVNRQDLAVIERNRLFPQLNATTTASVYRTEIVRLRNTTRAHEQERLKWQHELRKIKKKFKDEERKYDGILQQWQENRNRCHKHYTTEVSDFVFSCADCNKRVHKRINQICGESSKITGSGVGDVSLLSDDVSD